MNQAIANKIKKINQRYVSHLKKIEGGNIFDDIYDAVNSVTNKISSGVSDAVHAIGLGKPMKKYVKGSYKGGRVLAAAPMVEELKEEQLPMKDRYVLPMKDSYVLPKEISVKELPMLDEIQPTKNKSWFDKAKDMVSNFFGNGKKKPTKKQMKQIEKIFMERGHQIKGGSFWSDLGSWGKEQLRQQGDNVYAKAALQGLEDVGAGKPRKVNERAKVVRKYMDDHNCSMIEASKKVKQLGLY